MNIVFDHPEPALLVHGGMLTIIHQTKAALEELGCQVDYLRWWDTTQRADIVHYFGRMPPHLLRLAQAKGIKVVLGELLAVQGSRPQWQLWCQRQITLMLQTFMPAQFTAAFRWESPRLADAHLSSTPWEAHLLNYLFGAPKERIHVIPNGVETAFLQSTPAARGQWLVCTATITERKRVLELAEAAVRARTPLWVVGKSYSDSDAYARRFFELVRAHPQMLRFEGPIMDRLKLAQAYRESRGFVLLSASESLSLSALEAAACQCPLLLADLPWARTTFQEHASYCPLTRSTRLTARFLRQFYEAAPQLPAPPKPPSWIEVAKQVKAVYEGLMRTAVAVVATLACLFVSLSAARGQNVLSNQWTLDIGSYSDSAPAVGTDGTIYVGTWKGKLWAINPDGTPRWVFAAGNEIRSAPAVGLDNTVYFGSRDRKFYAVRPGGQRRWEFQTGGWVDSSPALAHDGTVYFGSWDKSFYALNADGKKQWQFPTLGEIGSSPAIGTDGTIYFGSHDRKFYALAADGRKKWEFPTGGPIISSPALNQDQCLYFTSVDGFLYALNMHGSLRWRLRTGGITESSPVIGADGTVYVGVGARLWAISADGQKKWGRAGDEEYPFDPTPVVLADGSICCVGRLGMLWYESPQGEGRWMNYLFGYGYGSPGIGPNGDIYVPDRRAFAACGFTALRAGVALAHTPWPKFRGNPRNTGNILDAAP